jgi:WG containing repeat
MLLVAVAEIAYGLTHQDLIPIIRKHDLEERDYLNGETQNLQPFEDPKNKLMGYKNKHGEVVINPQFDRALTFNKFGIADVFLKPDKWYKIDTKGKKLYQSYFFDNGPDYYVSGLMRFIENGKIGFADRHGKIVIPASFDFATPFSYSAPITMVCNGCQKKCSSKNLCNHAEMIGGKWGMIDSKGEVIVPIAFDAYAVFADGTINFLKKDYVFRTYLKKQSDNQ